MYILVQCASFCKSFAQHKTFARRIYVHIDKMIDMISAKVRKYATFSNFCVFWKASLIKQRVNDWSIFWISRLLPFAFLLCTIAITVLSTLAVLVILLYCNIFLTAWCRDLSTSDVSHFELHRSKSTWPNSWYLLSNL